MASVEKYKQPSVYAMLRHNERSSASYSNPDIDLSKFNQNYRLSPDHGCTDFDYFKQHLEKYQFMNRNDIVKMATWVVTAPEDLPTEQEEIFFRCCHDFLKDRYGEVNELQCIVHYDEIHTYYDPKTRTLKLSRPHLHYSFIPAIEEKGTLHICAKKVLTKQDLRNFHLDLQRYLVKQGVEGTVYSGVTAQNGGNVRVKELKKEATTIGQNYKQERRFEF